MWHPFNIMVVNKIGQFARGFIIQISIEVMFGSLESFQFVEQRQEVVNFGTKI
jgi:hypothetical protein